MIHRPHDPACGCAPPGPPASIPHPTVDENAPRPVRVFHALREVTRSQKQLMLDRISEKGAHPGQAFSLWVLSKNDGISQTELADVLHVSRPTVTIMVKKMESAGLIERRPDAHDNRVVRLHVTDAGRALQADLHAVHESMVADTITPLADEDQLELERLLGLVQDNITAAAARSQKGTR